MRRRGRILIVSEPMEYGVLSYLERLFEGLDRAQWEPALVFSPRRMAPQARRLVSRLASEGVRVRSLPFHRGLGLGDAVAARGLLAEVRAFRPDAVHLHSTKAGLIGRVIARRLGVPALYSPHGTSWHYTGRMAGRAQLLLERALRPATALLVSVCAEEAKAFAEEIGFGADAIRVIPNGVRVTERVRLTAVRERIRARLGMSPGEAWAVFVGRLTPEKGLDVLLRALPDASPLAGLLVVGEGPERLRLRAEAARAPVPVRFCGYQEDVSGVLAAGDIFVQPSRSEGLPFSLLEAMAHGLPVVASGVGGMLGAVEGCGRLVPPADPGSLAAALRTLAGDAEMRRIVGEAGRTRITRDFDLSAMLAALHEVYADACARGGHQRHPRRAVA
jgi:glycosyltransferase involved in cell wall biosynthesis